MKKFLLAMMIVLSVAAFSVPAVAFSPQFCTPSGEKSADANAIVSGPGFLYALMVTTDGTNAVTVKIYDALTATGTLLVPSPVVTSSSTDRVQYIVFPVPVSFDTGLSVDITTSGTCTYEVYYRKK